MTDYDDWKLRGHDDGGPEVSELDLCERLPMTPFGDAMHFLGLSGFGVEPCLSTGLWLAFPLGRSGESHQQWFYRGKTPQMALQGLLENLGLNDLASRSTPVCTPEDLTY